MPNLKTVNTFYVSHNKVISCIAVIFVITAATKQTNHAMTYLKRDEALSARLFAAFNRRSNDPLPIGAQNTKFF